LPEGPLDWAIGCTGGRWEALGRFVEDGHLELDTSRSGRAQRAVASGCRSWVQFGNAKDGHAAAISSSLIATCT